MLMKRAKAYSSWCTDKRPLDLRPLEMPPADKNAPDKKPLVYNYLFTKNI